MGHTARSGQASDQDSQSGPGRHRQSSGQIAWNAPDETTGQDQNWVTLNPPTPTLADPQPTGKDTLAAHIAAVTGVPPVSADVWPLVDSLSEQSQRQRRVLDAVIRTRVPTRTTGGQTS